MWLTSLLLSVAVPTAASVAASPLAQSPAYTYDNSHVSSLTTDAPAERGPPVQARRATTRIPDGLRPLGTFTRTDGRVSPSIYGYDNVSGFVQTARGGQAAREGHSTSLVARVFVERSGVAAETAPELASGLERTGTALSKSDAFHRSVSWVVDNPAAQRFAIKGGDGVSRELYQLPDEVNGKSGVFEWIIDRSGSNPVINHQRFIPGGSVSGFPNQVVP